MSKFIRIALFLLCTLPYQQLSAQFLLDSTVLDTTVLIDDLDIPWEMIYGPDDWLWVTERFGRVSRIHPETGQQKIILNISNEVQDVGESGMLGMALHPDFQNSPYVFLVYTYLDGANIRERLVRYIYNGDSLLNQQILLDGILGNGIHNGSRLLISGNDKLFMTTGDADMSSLAQDIQSVNGKILRLNLDGSIPNDNPFSNNPVWSWGHRNAQGLAMHPSGMLFSSEHGPSTNDEFNFIMKGGNYGWSDVEGFCDQAAEQQFCADSSVIEPLTNWTPTIAPSDLIWYDHNAIPEWKNSFLMTTLKDKKLVQVKLDASLNSVEFKRPYFTQVFKRLRDICTDPSGNVYLATNGDSWTNTDPFSHRIIKLSNENYTGLKDPIENQFRYIVLGNTLSIEHGNIYDNHSFIIYDINGKKVMEGRLKHSLTDLFLDFSKGTYILVVDKAAAQRIDFY